MYYYLRNILVMLFIISNLGYILIILKEKFYLRNNMIFIDSKTLSQQHLDEVETKYFRIGSIEVMAGDEIKIYYKNNQTLKGTILGAKLQDNRLLMVTSKDKIESIYVEDIKNIKVISRYGKFLKLF